MFRRAVGIAVSAGLTILAVQGQGVKHAITGDIERVDKEGRKVVVKTADGTEETFHYTEKTSVSGAKHVAHATELTGKEGGHVVVRYTGEGASKTADGFEMLGHGTMTAADVTVKSVDKSGRKVVVKTKEGGEETYDLGKRATIDTKGGVMDAAHFTAKEGDHIVVYHTQQAGKKVVHFVKKVGGE